MTDSPDRLIVIETETAFVVAWAQAPEDWVASFDKSGRFPARDWAERMVTLYALQAPDRVAPAFTGSHHPSL